MANLASPPNTNDIGLTYKGILNLGATVNQNLSGTLQSITDGDGNASPLQLSTTLVGITSNVNIGGTFTNAARLHVRGDGTNPIARFETNTTLNGLTLNGINGALQIGASLQNIISSYDGSSTSISGLGLVFGNSATNQNLLDFLFSNGGRTNTTGTSGSISIFSPFGAAAGSANHRPLNIAYTINNSGLQTGTLTGIFLNATQTNLNGMSHNVADLQVNSSSVFRVNNSGSILNPIGGNYNGGQYGSIGRGFITFTSNGVVRLDNASENDFNRLQFGGTTNLYPSLERSNATINFKLADNSNYCQYTGRVGNFTTTNKNAISTPLAGLLVYDTTLNKLSFYNGSAWEVVTSV